MKNKPYVIHCAIVQHIEHGIIFGYAQDRAGAANFYREFSNQLILDFNAYGGGVLDETYIMLHCNLESDTLSDEDKEDILHTVSFYIMQTVLLAPAIYEDYNCNFEGLTIIKA